MKTIRIPFKYIFYSFLLCFIMFSLTGCGKDDKIENYKANMNQFFENIRIFDSSINAIDPNSETATTELLSLLDSMNTSFSQMASLEVPESFPGVEDLATQASEYMSEAVSFYHQAYDGEYDATLEDVARQNYERANLRLQYIVSILHGDIPEEIYTYEDDQTDNPTEDEFSEDEFAEE
ncbi:MAG: hypothetical protein HDR20_01595 [Lachnospiraceae bacterium]|nr:hypothetical protein [Lachnospiraceae bacterium]